MTYIGKRIKVGFATNYANPALNLYPIYTAGLVFLKIGKLQIDNKKAMKILSTKYYKWRYEKEYRIFTELCSENEDGGLFFEPFSNNIQLLEVIIGYSLNKTKSILLVTYW